MTRRAYSNVAPAVQTAGSLTASATSVTITSVTGFPSTFPYTAALERGTASEELVLVTTAVGTSLTITRGYGGTTGKTHAASVAFEHVVDATDADEANAHVNATTGVHGLTGLPVGLTDTQTVTNKTLQASKGQATTTDPALLTQVAASGTQPHLIGKDSAGVTTEYQVSRGGAASFKAMDVQALTATSVASSGAVSGTTGTFSSTLSGASLTTGGNLTVTGSATTGGLTSSSVTTSGAVTAASGAFSGNVTANNLPAVLAAKAGKRIHWGTQSVTTDAGGIATITHGCGFTPTVVQPTALLTAGHAGVIGVDNITGTTFRMRLDTAGVVGPLTMMFICCE